MNKDLNKLGMDIAREIAPNLYEDLAKEPLQTTGKVFDLLPRSIKALCLPLEKWVLNREFAIKELSIRLNKKLEKIKDDDIISPDIYIAVPLIEQYSYCTDKEELKNLYANLLASSMNKEMRNSVHPGFVDIIKQLSPDEAKIMKELDNVKREAILDVNAVNEKKESIATYKNYSLIAYRSKCDCPENTCSYIDNLTRLGLIINEMGIKYLTDESHYKRIEDLKQVKDLEDQIRKRNDEYNVAHVDKGYIELTNFGQLFCKICIND